MPDLTPSFELREIAIALSVLAILVLVSATLRRRIPFLRSLFIPNAIVAGVVGLLLGPQLLGAIFDSGPLENGLFQESTLEIWSALPGLLINVVFAAILLGKVLPSLREIWDASASSALFGATLSFGQYAFGMLLAALVLVPLFGMSELSGALLEVSFSGGHGTAAGLAATMAEAGFEEGADLALGLATVGLLGGLLVGTFLINYAVRHEDITIAREQEVELDEDYELDANQDHVDVPERDRPDPATSTLTLVIGAIGLAITVGWLIQQALIAAEVLITGAAASETFLGDVPLFPFTIIGGAVVQLALSRLGWTHLVSREMVNQVSGLSLDLLIAAAIATLSISTLGQNIIPFALMILVAGGWSIAAFVWLAPRFYGKTWFERGIGDFGQSTGSVASGFMLIDMSDPQAITKARESYSYKQLLYEPFFGGGLITALSIPILVRIGLVPALIVSSLLLVLTIAAGLWLRRTAEGR